MRLERARGDEAVRFRRGETQPRAIAWFGFTAFWGHLRHLLASAIATDNVDSRQWMTPEAPDALFDRIKRVLAPRGANQDAKSLAAAFGGEVWIDFVADTGDDATVSEAVAKLLFEDYEWDELRLPRAHVLLHGGDIAYPVATVREISRRLLVPWNKVLESRGEEEPRVLLAVAGNHDWYDGLDGFARLCQAPCEFETPAPRSETLYPQANEFPVLAWAEAFSKGVTVRKPGALALFGYYPVQRASYFRLPLTRDVEMWGVDRQLRQVDRRQREFFRSAEPSRGRLIVLPDPARAWGEVRRNGAATLRAIGVDPSAERAYVLSGDVHHYERSHAGDSVHVVAGGGGAFLHGARTAGGAAYDVVTEFPGRAASRAFLWRLPLWVARGGAGWLLTSLFAVMQAFGLSAYARHDLGIATTSGAIETALVAISTALLVGWRRHRMHRVLPFALAIGLFVAATPLGVSMAFDQLGVRVMGGGRGAGALSLLGAWALATWLSGAGFGFMLAVIARLGLNHAQPYAALGLPTHKHFVRMRVREEDGATTIDSYVIGQVDPIGGSPPVLVDTFTWSVRT